MTSTAPVIAADRVFGDALQDALDIVGQEANKTDAVITKARQEINELKNKQAWLRMYLIISSAGLMVSQLLHVSRGKLHEGNLFELSGGFNYCPNFWVL